MAKKGTRFCSGGCGEPILLLLLFHYVRRFGLASYTHRAAQRCSTFVRIKRGSGYAQGSKSLHEREEVMTLCAALKCIEHPDDDLNLYATLRGSYSL
jgi:hypothetical protein